MNDYENYSKLDFTINSEDGFYDTVDMESFHDKDAQTIYDYLNEKMKIIPFGDYLKRYIFKVADMDGNFDEIDIKEYQQIIIDSFSENNTPKSFTETTAKLSALAKNWLTQTSVKRSVVFLLGFGLGMSAKDVSEFLVHAQRERNFNFKDPFETICWYCYQNGYKYPKFVQLMEEYKNLPVNSEYININETIGVRDLFFGINSEEVLMNKLSEIKSESNGQHFSVSTRKCFDNLYQKAKEIIAEKYTDDSKEEASQKASAYFEKAENSVSLTLEEKILRSEKIRNSATTYSADDITESDVEKFLCCGIPFDGKGNLLKFSTSKLAKHFDNKRMSRQHINEILSTKKDVDRFDLITLNFFIYAMNEKQTNNKKRYFDFTIETNNILEKCNMGELYVVNPYECFLLMCLLSDCPMGAYSDVLEKSFEERSDN